jgi:glycosyltransferase involved in cell wall biosynthesis
MERATVRAASAVVTAGQVQADRLAARYGVTPTVVRTAAPLLGSPHEPPERATVLGYLGVLGEQDGVDRLVRAAGLLRDRGLTVRIAGDGPELPRLRALVAELGLTGTVELCGWLQESQLEEFLAGVHGFVVPDPVNDFNDSCPMLKVSHALGAGLPVVMTPLKENLALTGGAGFVAAGDTPEQLAGAIGQWLASDVATRSAQGEALRERWRQELDPAHHMSRYVAALESAVAAARPSPTRS